MLEDQSEQGASRQNASSAEQSKRRGSQPAVQPFQESDASLQNSRANDALILAKSQEILKSFCDCLELVEQEQARLDKIIRDSDQYKQQQLISQQRERANGPVAASHKGPNILNSTPRSLGGVDLVLAHLHLPCSPLHLSRLLTHISC